MCLPVLFKDILLDYDRFTVRTKGIVNILWYLRQLHATSRLRKVFVCQIINRLHLLQLQRAVSIQRVALAVSHPFHITCLLHPIHVEDNHLIRKSTSIPHGFAGVVDDTIIPFRNQSVSK